MNVIVVSRVPVRVGMLTDSSDDGDLVKVIESDADPLFELVGSRLYVAVREFDRAPVSVLDCERHRVGDTVRDATEGELLRDSE